jgi:hypothetical protein
VSVENLASRLASIAPGTEAGVWQRHAAARTARRALDGRAGDARWGTRSGFPVLYLGRPLDSVIVEAYRHLVDPVEVDDPADREALIDNLMPRVLVTVQVDVGQLLDLRSASARSHAGLTIQDLTSETSDRAAYGRCQEVALVAHQLGRRGVLAPAATGLGETLALFTDLLAASERPVRIEPDQAWGRLPQDPRAASQPPLRVVRHDEG